MLAHTHTHLLLQFKVVSLSFRTHALYSSFLFLFFHAAPFCHLFFFPLVPKPPNKKYRKIKEMEREKSQASKRHVASIFRVSREMEPPSCLCWPTGAARGVVDPATAGMVHSRPLFSPTICLVSPFTLILTLAYSTVVHLCIPVSSCARPCCFE